MSSLLDSHDFEPAIYPLHSMCITFNTFHSNSNRLGGISHPNTVCVCERACMRVCAHICACMRVCVRACMCVYNDSALYSKIEEFGDEKCSSIVKIDLLLSLFAAMPC